MICSEEPTFRPLSETGRRNLFCPNLPSQSEIYTGIPATKNLACRDLNEEFRLPQPDRDCPLDEVIEDFGRRLRPDGPDGEIDEWSIYDESFRRLVSWADENGRFYQGLQAVKEGGREHDLTFDPATASWLKFTKPFKAGYVVSFDFGSPSLEPGIPLEYLERLQLQNELFGDQVTFVGIGGQRNQPTIITRQADVPGEPADDSEIIKMMTHELGFNALPPRLSVGYHDSLAFLREDVACSIFALQTW